MVATEIVSGHSGMSQNLFSEVAAAVSPTNEGALTSVMGRVIDLIAHSCLVTKDIQS